jgi:Spy/CpxP family protein refolding chaperone
MQDDVAAVLTPAQRERFEQLIREQRARLQEVKARARLAQPEESAPAPSK